MLFYIHTADKPNNRSMKNTNSIHFNRRKKERILYGDYKMLIVTQSSFIIMQTSSFCLLFWVDFVCIDLLECFTQGYLLTAYYFS